LEGLTGNKGFLLYSDNGHCFLPQVVQAVVVAL
jgi:hypothetical protein